jgi:hypothetical protein
MGVSGTWVHPGLWVTFRDAPGTRVDKQFKLRNRSSGPEIVHFGGSKRPFLPQNQLEKVGGFAPPPFSVGFAVWGGPLRPPQIDDFRPGVQRDPVVVYWPSGVLAGGNSRQ